MFVRTFLPCFAKIFSFTRAGFYCGVCITQGVPGTTGAAGPDGPPGLTGDLGDPGAEGPRGEQVSVIFEGKNLNRKQQILSPQCYTQKQFIVSKM